ncbi:MAG: hypothetical protein LC660_06200 [Desulfobacteraceae bacterium]|nr:hypothetical protein [Desulfobacteraceae bacterium]
MRGNPGLGRGCLPGGRDCAGPARYVSYQKERPIQMVWQLSCPMPVEMFEENRRGG